MAAVVITIKAAMLTGWVAVRTAKGPIFAMARLARLARARLANKARLASLGTASWARLALACVIQ